MGKKTKYGGASAYVVEEDSAAPKWDDAEPCGVFATHDNMIKFSDIHDQGYSVLLKALGRYIAKATDLTHYRWDKEMQTMEHEQ